MNGGSLRRLERAERPEKPDRQHLGARAVAGPAMAAIAPETVKITPAATTSTNSAERRARESSPSDQRERARVEQRAGRDGGGEPAAGHGSSERTAAPDRSAFAMNPRAPLEEIRPL